jgi:hypothetical protein
VIHRHRLCRVGARHHQLIYARVQVAGRGWPAAPVVIVRTGWYGARRAACRQEERGCCLLRRCNVGVFDGEPEARFEGATECREHGEGGPRASAQNGCCCSRCCCPRNGCCWVYWRVPYCCWWAHEGRSQPQGPVALSYVTSGVGGEDRWERVR